MLGSNVDLQSAGVILRLLNLVALADGGVSLEEENLLQSLSEQYKLQAKFVTWEDQVTDPSSIEELAALVHPEQRDLAMKTAVMVASASRPPEDDAFICPSESAILNRLAAALELGPEQRSAIEAAAAQELEKHPNLWQVLYSLFGHRFDWPGPA